MIHIRKAEIIDIPAITEIYNDAVLNTTATFDTEKKTMEDRKTWLLNRNENFPVIVSEVNEQVVGYASLNRWSDKKAYDVMAEISVYIHPLFRGRGIGKKLVSQLVKMGEETNLLSILARITQGNEQSIHLHKLCGFEVIGIMKKCGIKFNEVLDVTLMQKLYSR